MNLRNEGLSLSVFETKRIWWENT